MTSIPACTCRSWGMWNFTAIYYTTTKKKVKVMKNILACTCRSWGHQAEPCGWIYARHVEREPWRIAFKQFQNWSKVNSEVHSREDFLDTKANQPCGYLSQRLSQTAASCSCSCSSDESSWLHFPQPLYSPLVSDYSQDNMSYLNFLPTLSQNFVNGLLVPTYKLMLIPSSVHSADMQFVISAMSSTRVKELITNRISRLHSLYWVNFDFNRVFRNKWDQFVFE